MIALVGVLIVGWSLVDRVQEHLPGPVNVVIDSFQSGGTPGGGPILQQADESGASDPLAACPEFAADTQVFLEVVAVAAPDGQARVAANNTLIESELVRVADGGKAVPLASSGAADALIDQATVLDAIARGLTRASFQTQEARSLAVGVAAAADRVATASRAFVDQADGTATQWRQWLEAVSGPLQQVMSAGRGFERCP